MESLYPYSVLIDHETVKKAGALTKLPVRLHKHDHLARAGSLCLTGDWGRIMQDGQEKISHGTPCKQGNWASFIFPECHPDRLGLLTYLHDVGCLHDDATDNLTIAEAQQAHLELDAALDTDDSRSLSKDSRSMKTKSLVSAAMLECMKIDRPGTIWMLNSYRNQWLSVMEHSDPEDIQDIDEYFHLRARNGGVDAYYAMLAFSLGLIITDEELEFLQPTLKPVGRCFLLSNDYWSWPREKEQAANQNEAKIFNAVWFLMKQDGLLEEEALEKVCEMRAETEQEWVRAKADLFESNPNLPAHLGMFMESVHTSVAGNDYWNALCPRHNDWKSLPEQPGDDHPKVTELADLGLSVMSNPNGSRKTESISRTDTEGSGAKVRETIHGRNRIREHSQSSDDSGVDMKLTVAKRTRSDPLKTSTLRGRGLLDSGVILAPIDHISSLPSKGFRKDLIDCLNIWLEIPPAELDTIKTVTTMLHDSSLILDDIADGSNLRRGSPAAHVIFGSGQAMNSGLFLYVQAVELINRLDNKEMMNVVLTQLRELFIGQSWDLYWSFHQYCPTESEYLEMIDKKTGAFLSMIVSLMCAAKRDPSQNAEPLSNFSHLVGRYFQIRDDYCNLTSTMYSKQKGFCEDLDEGKFSYMMIHAMGTSARRKDSILGLFRSMRQQPENREAKEFILSTLEEAGSMAVTKNLLNSLQLDIDRAISDLEQHFGIANPMLHLLLETLRI